MKPEEGQKFTDSGLNRYKQAVDVAYNFLKKKRQAEATATKSPAKQ